MSWIYRKVEGLEEASRGSYIIIDAETGEYVAFADFAEDARKLAAAPELLRAAEENLKLWNASEIEREDAFYDDAQEQAERNLEAAVYEARYGEEVTAADPRCDTYELNHEEAAAEARAPVDHPE